MLVQAFSGFTIRFSEKIFNASFVRFFFFAETEDALAKLIFHMASKCLS